MYIDTLTYEQFIMLGDAELSRRFSMQDEAEQKAKIDREQANELEYVDESQKFRKQPFLLTSIRRLLWRG